MGLLIEFFAARSDEEAAATIEDGPGRAGFPVVDGWSIEPVVQMANLEELLTARGYQEIVARGDGVIADRNGGELLVVRLTDILAGVLADSTADRLRQVAVPWSRAEEFYGYGDPEMLTEFLGELSALARQARDNSDQLYCWVCV